MKRFSILRIAALLFLVVAGTLAPAAAEERAFKASGGGYVFQDNLYGRGEATHLGRSSLGLSLLPGLLSSNDIFLPSIGIFTSATGDQLHFDFDAEYYDIDPATGIVSATLTFIGGTGRFQDATGNADVMFVFDSDFQDFLFLIDGSIDY